MNNEIRSFINHQLDSYNTQYQKVIDALRTKNIEIRLIDKQLKQMKENRDDRVDILSPDHGAFDFHESESSSLQSRKLQMTLDIDLLQTEKERLEKEITHVKSLLNLEEKEAAVDEDNTTIDVIKIQEQDRQRIARDIHDSVVQNLSALIRKIEFTTKIIQQDPSRAKLEMDASKDILKESIQELRSIIYDLRPMALDDLGFESAFYNLCEQIKNSYDGVFEYEYTGSGILSNELSICLLRIIRELTSNSVKYSNGSKISVKVQAGADTVSIIESDGGTGFNYYESIGMKENETGFGLSMLKERVSLFHGTINFSNDNGTMYEITFPLGLRGKENVN